MSIEPLQGVILAVQGWTCKEIIQLKIETATLTGKRKRVKTKSITSLLLIAILGFAATLLAGCIAPPGSASSMGGLVVGNSQVTTNAVEQVETETTVSTNSIGEVSTNSYTITNIVYVPVTNTVYIPNPNVTATIETGKAVAAVVPPPFSTYSELALGGLSGILAILAAFKNRQAKSTEEQIAAIIRGVESAASSISADSIRVVKDRIATKAQMAGPEIISAINKKVQALT